jgi:asparagine synthase (glutamine-hydrolysing)
MCGIWFYIGLNTAHTQEEIKKSSDKLIPRGPDNNKFIEIIYNKFSMYLSFYRLAIMDLSDKGNQPFIHIDQNRKIYLMCNGEIYNYKHLVNKYNLQDKLRSDSDCEVLIHLYEMIGIDGLYNELMSDDVDGEFAFIIVDIDSDNKIQIHTARDMGGVRPLYKCKYYDTNDNNLVGLCYSSQLSGIPYIKSNRYHKKCDQLRPYSYNTYTFYQESITNRLKFDVSKKEYNIRDIPITIYDENEALERIRNTFIKCVEQRMSADREIMFMCSGGLDSSLCAGIGAKFASKHNMRVNTMCIGLDGGTDEKYANLVAKHINSKHIHVLCSEDEFLEAAKTRVIDTVESYDITTIRASTGQLISAEKIRKLTDCKVVIIGDYSDEICGGYNETKYAPTLDDYKERIYELVENIHYFDAQRADRCIASNGLEARTPFADHRFIKLFLSIDPKLRCPKKGVEKYLLRKAFDNTDYIPNEVLWRPKEAFSDGVSSLKKSWYQILQEDINKLYDTIDDNDIKIKYKINVPYTAESLYYRQRFCETFSNDIANVIPYFWLPKWGNVLDPSARVLSVYSLN